jgi:hypothetical protein
MEKLGENVRRISIPNLGDVYFNMQRFSLTISEGHRYIYYFDADGRFMGGFFDGVSYRRGLDGRIMMKIPEEDGFRRRKMLALDERRGVIDDVNRRVSIIREFICGMDGFEDISNWLDRILSWDFDKLESQGRIFYSIYKPLSVLPPDQYLSIVLQLAEGCSWNECTFCNFYRDRKFRVKSVDEFRVHCQQVKNFLGRSAGLRRSIFLADANALIIPQGRLVKLIEIIHDEFPVSSFRDGYDYKLDGIYSFLDIFGAERKTLSDYIELAKLSVRRIYIGLETGDRELFRILNKPGSPSECVEVVNTIKKAGISVGIIILAGIGGDKFYTAHLNNTVRSILEMNLDHRDIIYISPLVVTDDMEYFRISAELGIEELDRVEISGQVDKFKAMLRDGFRFLSFRDRPRVTLYDIHEFIY